MNKMKPVLLSRLSNGSNARGRAAWGITLALSLIAMPLVVGCGSEVEPVEVPAAADAPPASQTPPEAAEEAAEKSASAAPQTAAPELVERSWSEILASVKQPGKPAVLDVWSLGCEPCMKEFPGLVQLQNRYGDRLECVSANIDFDGRRSHPPETYRERAEIFLASVDATTTNYLCSTPSDEVYAELDLVSIPAVLVFDAEGNEVARFVDAGETRGFTYEKDVIPAVEQLLDGGSH